MPSQFQIGQSLRGRLGRYEITQQLFSTVWLGKASGAVACHPHTAVPTKSYNGTRHGETVIIKSVQGHFRVANERDVLRRFSGRSPHIRPIVDEIIQPSEPISIVLRHFDSTLLHASIERKLNRRELKHVSKSILQALRVMHSEGFVHAGEQTLKPLR